MRHHLGSLFGALLALILSGAGPAHAEAAPAAFPPETEAALQRIVDKHLAANGAPGALVGVWIPERGSFVRAQGLSDVESGTPLQELDNVRIGSITKTFVATLVLQLADAGLMSLDDSLLAYVPEVANGERITIRHLLGMTSGVPNFLDDPEFLAAYTADLQMPFSPRAALTISQQRPARFTPGEGFEYSETNYFLVGLVVEQVTRLTLNQAIDEWIVQPLGLASTSLPVSPEMPAPASRGYQPTSDGSLENVTLANPHATWAAGAMVSNLHDLRVWSRALATGELLSPAMQAERLQWTPVHGGDVLNARYGLGIMSLAGFVGHNGGMPGYSSIVMYLPEADATIVVLVNKSTLDGGAADFLFYDLGALLFPERFQSLRARP